MKTLSKLLVGTPLSLAALLTAGCPSEPVPTIDSGVVVGDDTGAGDSGAGDSGATLDTGTPSDAGPPAPGRCAMPRVITPALGVAMDVTGDTSGGASELMLAEECGNGPAPQDVLAVRIPGTGLAVLTFDLTNGTAANFDTLVQVRTVCATDPGGEFCFDDASETSIQSGGSLEVMGGTTVYLVITGYAGRPEFVSSGAYTANILVEGKTAPTLTAASAVRVGTERIYVEGTGMDAERDATGYAVQFLDAAGTPLRLDPDDPMSVGPFDFFRFDVPQRSAVFTSARSSIDLDGLEASAAAAIAVAVTARITAVDFYGLTSAPRDVAIVDAVEVVLGEACDTTHVCVAGSECTAGTCQPPAALVAACTGATAVTLVAPTGATPTVATQAVAFALGDGAILNECGGDGAERLFRVTVPAGGADLIATTNVAGTMMDLDTVVAIRATCTDALTELSCNDDYEDASEGDVRSTAVIGAAPAGTYTVIVDSYYALDSAATASVELRLRPVLAAGAACDPMGVMNRCATAACPVSGAAVCPAAPPAG